jgi:transposase
MILDLARQGLGVSAIARRTGHDRKTVRKYLARGLEPAAYKPRAPVASLLEPFEPICASGSYELRVIGTPEWG